MYMWWFLILGIIGIKIFTILVFVNKKHRNLWSIGIGAMFGATAAVFIRLIPEITKLSQGMYWPF